MVHVLDNGGSPENEQELQVYRRVTGAQMWARVGQPNLGGAMGRVAPRDRLSASIISVDHRTTFEPGWFFAQGWLGPRLRQMGEALAELGTCRC